MEENLNVINIYKNEITYEGREDIRQINNNISVINMSGRSIVGTQIKYNIISKKKLVI